MVRGWRGEQDQLSELQVTLIRIKGEREIIQLTHLRDLDVGGATEGASDYLGAASGLVRVGSTLYVVADDDLHLAAFDLHGSDPGVLIRLLPGDLPAAAKARKRAKPDFEILVALPRLAVAPHGGLLALGSGSRPNRMRGSLLGFDEQLKPTGVARVVDASGLYARLREEFEELNLEGAWVSGGTLHLLQRGHRRRAANVVINLDLQTVLKALLEGGPAPAPLSLHPIALGECQGVPLCFSDACGLSDERWIFTAVAEDTDSSYDDGGFVGASIGLADAQLNPIWIQPVHPALKIEGVDATEEAGRLRLLLVTDADDPAVPAGLYSASVVT